MFDLKNPSFGEQVIDALAPFFTLGVLWRVASLLGGTSLIYISIRMMLRGEYTFYDRYFHPSAPPGWQFTAWLTAAGILLIYVGLRGGKHSEGSDGRPDLPEKGKDQTGK